MSYEPLCSIQDSVLQNAANHSRNKLIYEAYQTIVNRVSNLIADDFNRAWNKFPRFYKGEIKEANIIQAFYTPCCSLKLLVRRSNYIIVLAVADQSLRAGYGSKSTELLSIAFEATRYHKDSLTIQGAVEIRVDNNVEAIYKRKVEEREDSKNLEYYNQRMGIMG